VNEVRHPPDGGLRRSQQRIACLEAREVADERNRQVRPGRSLDRSGNRIPVHVGEHGSYTFADQGLGNGTADAISRPGDQSCFTRGVEWVVQQAHVGRTPRDKFKVAAPTTE
jgi:hypothetical protein